MSGAIFICVPSQQADIEVQIEMPTGPVNKGTVNTGPVVLPEIKSSSPVIESLCKGFLLVPFALKEHSGIEGRA